MILELLGSFKFLSHQNQSHQRYYKAKLSAIGVSVTLREWWGLTRNRCLSHYRPTHRLLRNLKNLGLHLPQGTVTVCRIGYDRFYWAD